MKWFKPQLLQTVMHGLLKTIFSKKVLTYSINPDIIVFVRRSGGIGRRAGFRCLW